MLTLLPSPMPAAAAINHAGGAAYALSHEAALAQYAMTGCVGATFYADAEAQLADMIARCHRVDPGFVARTAVFARRRGFMKAMPALLCAWISAHARRYLPDVFAGVIDNGQMLRHFVGAIRSGVTWRTSLGTLPRRLIAQWLDVRPDEAVFRATVGKHPSLADVIRLAHPRPKTPSRRALYAWALGRPHDPNELPPLVREYLDFRARGGRGPLPDVPFQMLTSLDLDVAAWCHIARSVGWQALRMNLNTFARRGVFGEPGMPEVIAERLADPAEIRRARAFPYQLMTAWQVARQNLPTVVAQALERAMEVAVSNVPSLPGGVYVGVDVSGSMSSPVTGWYGRATTAARCIDVAALIAAAILRNNRRNAEVIPFGDRVVPVALYPGASVMKNAAQLAALDGGGTCSSAPLAWLNVRQARGKLVVMVSDSESWVDQRTDRQTETLVQWEIFRRRNPEARLVCIDLTPNTTAQCPERDDILHVGGFSDVVFELIALFASGEASGRGLVEAIERITVD